MDLSPEEVRVLLKAGKDQYGIVNEDNNVLTTDPVIDKLDYVTSDVIEVKGITDRMVELYSRKNRDYGNTFDKSLDEDGLLVAKIRLGDKMGRFSQLLKQEGTVEDESTVDTLIDLANYAVMTIRWIEEQERGYEDA